MAWSRRVAEADDRRRAELRAEEGQRRQDRERSKGEGERSRHLKQVHSHAQHEANLAQARIDNPSCVRCSAAIDDDLEAYAGHWYSSPIRQTTTRDAVLAENGVDVWKDFVEIKLRQCSMTQGLCAGCITEMSELINIARRRLEARRGDTDERMEKRFAKSTKASNEVMMKAFWNPPVAVLWNVHLCRMHGVVDSFDEYLATLPAGVLSIGLLLVRSLYTRVIPASPVTAGSNSSSSLLYRCVCVISM